MNTAATTGVLSGKVVIVTGAGQPTSIGRAHAMAFAAAGAAVVVNDNGSSAAGDGADAAPANRVAAEIRAGGGRAVASVDSVATTAGARAIVQTALDSYGRLDILINNAGNQRMGRIMEASEEDFDSLVGVHLKGTFNMVRWASPHLIAQRGGVIVNTSSTAGLGMYGNSIYAAAKEGIIGFTRSIARDLGPYGIRCNAIRPGAVSRMRSDPKAAELAREAERGHGFPTAWNQWLVRDVGGEAPAPHLAPEHIANFVVWLCTDAAASANGVAFRVAGGEIGVMSDPDVVRSIFRPGGWDLESLDQEAVRTYLLRGLDNRFIGK